MIEDVESKCEVCTKYKRPSPKPIVSFPLAKEFNETVAMDLKVYDGHYILHLIDHATRFSAATVISSKTKENIISKVRLNLMKN